MAARSAGLKLADMLKVVSNSKGFDRLMKPVKQDPLYVQVTKPLAPRFRLYHRLRERWCVR